ncbi:glycoside hydrolase domain-containing protein [Gottfriedia sp. OAE603]|uniref:glycoside hydrolase domain-containing protein n=1 Tax=Gottfriedia sp. OAE603 TaxID=2663872 RepID=UPI00366D84C5
MSSLNWKPIIFILVSVVLLFSIIFGVMSSKEDSSRNHEKQEQIDPSTKSFYWGVDSASNITNQFLTCVKKEFGTPEVWGRYLGTKEDVSKGITKKEAALLHSKKIKILLINNQFVSATGYKNGIKQAQVGGKLASALDVPKGTAIFADIEPIYEVDAEFIKGYYDEMKKMGYVSGIYGVFDNGQDLSKAYKQAAKEHRRLSKETILWTAFPQRGITSKTKAPEFLAGGPSDSKIYGWQYGLDATDCNIDTNLFKGDLIKFLW